MMMRAPAVVVMPPALPYRTLQELVTAAKARPGKLNHGGGSAGYQLNRAKSIVPRDHGSQDGLDGIHAGEQRSPASRKASR